MLNEAKRLYDIGFGVHWIKPGSKAPVKAGWSGPKRDSFDQLMKSYRKGFGLGVRLGEPSCIDGKYLAVIDIDVKCQNKRYNGEYKACIEKHFPGLLKLKPPRVKSGRGGGSMHIYVLVDEPLPSYRISASNDLVEVYSPTSAISRIQKQKLCQEKLDKGIRLKPAWEIDFMCAGKQVVLPPSMHPDTNLPYIWLADIIDENSLPVLSGKMAPRKGSIDEKGKASGDGARALDFEFCPTSIDLFELDLPEHILDMIVSGEGVEDRSAAIMTVSLSMLKRGISDMDILTVLTDRDNFLGEAAFEHAKTADRVRAAKWISNYTLRKAKNETSALAAFKDEVVIETPLSKAEAKKQFEEIVQPTITEDSPWQDQLRRNQQGMVKPVLFNACLILQNIVGKKVFVHDSFECSTFHGVRTPWGAKKGSPITDESIVNIKYWLSSKFKIEFPANIIYEVVTQIATENTIHSVRDMLEALPEWDGVERINHWLAEHFGVVAPEPYLSEVSRKFLLAMIERVYNPGAKFDHMLILEGMQDMGKSSMGQILVGSKWFQDGLPDLHNKDASLALSGKWLIELPELANFKRSEVETIKSFLTRQIDNVRPPYGRMIKEYKRQCIFFGTTNDYFYLKDQTGNRRFWPVLATKKLDFKAFRLVREQLLAEALWYHQNMGEQLYLSKEAREQALEVQSSRVAEDEESMIQNAIVDFVKRESKKPAGDSFNFRGFYLKSLFEGFGPLQEFKEDSYRYQLAGRALKRIGFERFKSSNTYKWRVSRDKHSKQTRKLRHMLYRPKH